MDDPDEPHVKLTPARIEPIETYQGQGAIVSLFSWGTERSPAYSLRVVRLVDGRMTCGRTFTGASLADLRYAAPGYVGAHQAALDDIERCLSLADRQRHFTFIEDEAAP